MTGQLAPETDTETGKMINPHNPDFISRRPWYLGESGPSLKHHSKQKVDHVLSLHEADSLVHAKWSTKKEAAVKFRPGACTNCGAMGHKAMECVERPRSAKNAAWKSGQDIAPDDISLSLDKFGKVSFDAKRDRWLGYHPDQHKEVVERYNKLDAERQRVRQVKQEAERKEKAASKESRKKTKKEKAAGGGSGKKSSRKRTGAGEGEQAADSDELSDSEGGKSSDSDSDSDYDSDADSSDDNKEFIEKDTDQRDFQGRVARQGGLGGAQMATTVRNLRIREDRAKYLYNLDPNSAYYDPKTRSMRDNPNPNANADELLFAGDNFIRYGGDVNSFAKTQVYAWDAANRGQDLHPMADATQTELLHKQFEENKKKLKETQKQRIVDAYGGTAAAPKPDGRLLLGQTEAYVEYDRSGRVIKGAQKAVAKSKYEEDVFPGNHTSVWGSYFDAKSMRWGFACCHSLTRQAYCTGEAGREANDATNSVLSIDREQEQKMLESRPPAERSDHNPIVARSTLFGENLNPVLDDSKLASALEKEKKFQQEGGEERDDRKRKYNSMVSSDVTAEEMEAYRMMKNKAEDPMANISSDKLIDEE